MRSQTTFMMVLVTGLFIAGCSSASATVASDQTVTSESTVNEPTEAITEATATTRPTQGPTATAWPPIFDPFRLGNILDLDSFIVTVNVKNTVNGDLTETTNTIAYNKEPFSGYSLLDLGSDSTKTYVIGGRTYDVNNFGNWYLSTEASNNFLFAADIPAGNTGELEGAVFAAEEEYQGLTAYHFVLEKTDNPPNENNVKSDVEGDLYLAKDGNYPLYAHSKRTTTQGDFRSVYEVTQVLSSINAVSEITLPADFLPMDKALELPQGVGLPLPEGSTLEGMIRYVSGGIGVDYYTYDATGTSMEEFLQFYRDLTPTDGWTVSHIGYVNLHYECESFRECVIINKGSAQVILYYKSGNIGADFDWPHVYSPL